MSIRSVLLMGNPVLRKPSEPVRMFGSHELASLVRDMGDTLTDSRRRHGFGRAIAAPQIGENQRVIVMDLGTVVALVNPVIIRKTRKTMTLWDDCFSFPDLVILVRRHIGVDVRYRDPEGLEHTIRAEGSLAELLQHEIDHLDGILAIDRAVDSRHIVYRKEFETWVGAHAGVAL
jgi:peptide deformylase